MFFPSTVFLFYPLLGFALAAPSLRPRQDTTGTISSPPNGASINPGASFDFLYNSRADYGITSLNYTVFLVTSAPVSLVPSAEFATGHFFGRFAEPNYPGNPNPSNTPPAQLVMPDFAQSPGGFGVGKGISNATFYLVVLEEYVDGTATVGAQMSLTANEIIYNGTISS